jgi:hypothetical protein
VHTKEFYKIDVGKVPRVLPVLVFQLPQPLRLAHFQPAVLGFPSIERLLADAVLPA